MLSWCLEAVPGTTELRRDLFSPCHPEWAATSMNRPIFSYVKKLCGNFYLALYALLLLIYPSTFLLPPRPCITLPYCSRLGLWIPFIDKRP
jgi:hypothetical protein